MGAPLATSPDSPYPGIHIAIDLVRGAQSAGAVGLKALIVTQKATGLGNLPVATEIRPIFSNEEMVEATGPSLGARAYEKLLLNDKKALVDVVACAAPAGVTATATFTFTEAPVANMVLEWDIKGNLIESPWNIGESVTEGAAAAIAAINTKASSNFCVATNIAGVLTLTANSAGTCGNDVKVSVRVKSGSGGVVTPNGTALAGGTLNADMTAALDLAKVDEYDYIILCMSNAEAQSATGNSVVLAAHIDGLNTGPGAKLQQGVYASTGTRAQALVNTEARNEKTLEHVCFQNSRDLPCEVAGAEVGDRMQRRRKTPNANRVNQPIKGLVGAVNKVANIPSESQMTAATKGGLTLYSYDAALKPKLLRGITTYHQDGDGNYDKRCRDLNEVDGIYDYVKDLRRGIPQEFQAPDGQLNIMRDRVEGDDQIPDNTVEERDVKSFITARTHSFWIPKGVIQGPAFDESVADGSLIVEVNDDEETQVDIFIPAKVVKILAKFGLFVAKES